MPFARLAASFWHWRQSFWCGERQGEGKGKTRGSTDSISILIAAVVWRCLAFLVQKPEMPFACLAASFWQERKFHGVEEGKGDHDRTSVTS